MTRFALKRSDVARGGSIALDQGFWRCRYFNIANSPGGRARALFRAFLATDDMGNFILPWHVAALDVCDGTSPTSHSRNKPGLPPWGPHVRFRRVQTLVREGGALVRLRC